MRLPDPVRRPGWIRRLPSADTSTALIREYLDSRVGCVNVDESTDCKTFLVVYASVVASGKRPGVKLSIGRSREAGTALIYFSVNRAKLADLPSLAVPMSPRIVHILREVSESRLHEIKPDPKPVDPFADDAKRGFPGGIKVETRIIPGRRI